MPEEATESCMATSAIPEGVPPAGSPDGGGNNDQQPPPPPPGPSVSVPLVNEVQLAAATGGAELSCYRCTVPFGVVVLIAGVVVTAVAYGFNTHGSTISYLGLTLLAAAAALLAASALCWRLRLDRKKERRRESQTALVASQRRLFS